MRATGTSHLPGGRTGRSDKPIEFVFDARNKSIVPNVFAKEAKRLKKFFVRKPKVSLHQMETALKEKVGDVELRKLIPIFLTSYYQSDSAHQYLESLSRLLLEAASKETEDVDRQWFLLQLALEHATLAIQKSPKVINISSQSIVVSICKILGPMYREAYHIEREIHKEMMTMVNIKKDPNDFASREKMVKLYMQERNYYEALVHSAEYEKIMQMKSRSLFRQKKGEIAMRKASIFQVMIDHYYRIRAGSEDEGISKVAELGKLSQFITRFNRDNNRVHITPLKGLDTLSLNKTLQSMVTITNTFYSEAAEVDHFPLKHKAKFFMARNSYQFDNPKAALKNLAEGVRIVELSRMSPKLAVTEKLKFLEFQHKIYTDLGHQRKADETNQDIAKLRREIRTTGG